MGNERSAKRKTVFNAVRVTTRGLHRAGVMRPETMREFDALCLPKVRDYSATQIKRIRERNNASQAVFAAYLIPASRPCKSGKGAKRSRMVRR